MKNKRFVAKMSDYDDNTYQIADTSKVEKTLDDFYNEKEEYYEYWDYISLLHDKKAFLSAEEVVKKLNALIEENELLKEKLGE